jgi:3-isopropylmalate/(R)-2-methylmalate dehydratase small subunit
MKKQFGGKVLFLDRSDINTDEIIPARYLTEITKEALKPFCLEDLELAGFNPATDIEGKSVLVTRANFGCGSSREHAPWALEVNGMYLVVAESFARIFRQNMYNCGMIAVELPSATLDTLFVEFGGKDVDCDVDIESCTMTFTSGSLEKSVSFELSGFDRALVDTGGWVEYADANY